MQLIQNKNQRKYYMIWALQVAIFLFSSLFMFSIIEEISNKAYIQYEQAISEEIKITGEVFIGGKMMIPESIISPYLEDNDVPIFIRETRFGKVYVASEEMVLKDDFNFTFSDGNYYLVSRETLDLKNDAIAWALFIVMCKILFIVACFIFAMKTIDELVRRQRIKKHMKTVV